MIINQNYKIDISKLPVGINEEILYKVLDFIGYEEKFIAFKLQQEFAKKLIVKNKELKTTILDFADYFEEKMKDDKKVPDVYFSNLNIINKLKEVESDTN